MSPPICARHSESSSVRRRTCRPLVKYMRIRAPTHAYVAEALPEVPIICFRRLKETVPGMCPVNCRQWAFQYPFGLEPPCYMYDKDLFIYSIYYSISVRLGVQNPTVCSTSLCTCPSVRRVFHQSNFFPLSSNDLDIARTVVYRVLGQNDLLILTED